jgi:putative endonuclease
MASGRYAIIAAEMRQQPWKVYLLRCADDTLYCGCTNDVERRLAAHARGRVKYTRGRLPVTLAHVEPAADKGAALRQEAAWKRLSRAEKLKRISKPETKARLRSGRKFAIANRCGKLHQGSA